MLHTWYGYLRLPKLFIHVFTQVFCFLCHFISHFCFSLCQSVLRCVLDLALQNMLSQCEIDYIHPMWLQLLFQRLLWLFSIRLHLFSSIEDVVEIAHELSVVNPLHHVGLLYFFRLEDGLLLCTQIGVDHRFYSILGGESLSCRYRHLNGVVALFESRELEILLEVVGLCSYWRCWWTVLQRSLFQIRLIAFWIIHFDFDNYKLF